MGSQVNHIIYNLELCIASRVLTSRPEVVHVNDILELFITSKALSL